MYHIVSINDYRRYRYRYRYRAYIILYLFILLFQTYILL